MSDPESVQASQRERLERLLATARMALANTDPLPSPCTSICCMNGDTGLCEGCLRTLDEIVAWSSIGDEVDNGKRSIWSNIGQRARLASHNLAERSMKHITFYFDVISPYAYLAFEHMPRALQGISYQVTYKPILFAGVLKHHGQLGPAEIAPKREWTYRQVQWLANQLDIEMKSPSAHPFNPLTLLRLAVACGVDGRPNRYVVETIFRHVWRSGLDAENATRIDAVTMALKPARDPNSPEVKAHLKDCTESAIQDGVFGVPTFKVDDKLFFGLDSLPMLAAYLKNDAWFEGSNWDDVLNISVGTSRQK